MTDALSMLVAERDRLNRAIEILQGETKRRGRKPGSVAAAAPAPKRRRKMSAKAKKAISDRMKKYWAARRKTSKK